MLIMEGNQLANYIRNQLEIQPTWEERDFVSCVKSYVDGSTEKVLAVSGLRGTGKTVGILQAIQPEETAYLLAQIGELESGEDTISFLKETDKKVVILDEYSWIQSRENLDRYLLTAVQNKKRVILAATESITLDFLNYGALNHRVQTIHTTLFSYEEYLRLYKKTPSKTACKEYLTEGGLFPEYILRNFDTTKRYIDEAIVGNLAGFLKDEISEEKARTLTYAVLYKAICPSNLPSIPTLRSNHVTMPNFLEQMGINSTLLPKEWELERVAEIFEQTGIIVRIPNYCKESSLKEQYYITNPSISCQLIKAVYGLRDIDGYLLGHLFEAAVAVRLATNRLEEHDIFFYNNGSEKGNGMNKELDIILTDKEREYAYYFECKLRKDPVLHPSDTILSNYLEQNEFQGVEIAGRYVVYNGVPHIGHFSMSEPIIFIPMGEMLDNYFEFEENLKRIGGVGSESGEWKSKVENRELEVESKE